MIKQNESFEFAARPGYLGYVHAQKKVKECLKTLENCASI